MTAPATGCLNWDAASACAAGVAAIAAAIAAWFSARQVTAAKDAVQIQIFENVFRDIRQQEREFYGVKKLSGEEKALRDRVFFNTINYLAFLLESKILKRREFLDYYHDAFLYWWTLFEKEVPDLDRNDPKKYEEFKRIVLEITRG